MTTSFHPQGDGQAEQMIQTIIQILQATIHPDQHNWVLQLPMTEFALNSSTNKSTGYAPDGNNIASNIRKCWVRANRALRGLDGPKAPRGLRAQRAPGALRALIAHVVPLCN